MRRRLDGHIVTRLELNQNNGMEFLCARISFNEWVDGVMVIEGVRVLDPQVED